MVGESVMAGTGRGVGASSPHVFEFRTQALVVEGFICCLSACTHVCLCLCRP